MPIHDRTRVEAGVFHDFRHRWVEELQRAVRAFVVPVAVGDPLTDLPLFLLPRGCVEVPLEATYQAAFDVFPRRWKPHLEG